LAFRQQGSDDGFQWIQENERNSKVVSTSYNLLRRPWDIFLFNDICLRQDFPRLCVGQPAATIHSSNTVIGKDLFVHETAEVLASNINTETGPVYIGPRARVLEGSNLRGPIALGESAVVKMGSIVYGATTLGPYCKVGGELSNVVMQGYSNKGHAGFLGNAVVGEWCNLGADTNASNLKNNYGNVKVWNYESEQLEQSDQQFCGLIMGDHSKAGINTMFNTATTVGVAANVFGADFPPKFIPSFSWGGFDKVPAELEKIYETAERMMSRRSLALTDADKRILKSIFERTAKYRS